tara:strand:+ start:538 stop:981 length:444 start_codon:yes stop_codon:yes gene_type:complete
MTSENRVHLSIVPIDNTKKHLCCNGCERPIYKHEYATVINNKYKLAPDFYKKCLVNDFTNGYDYINNSNLPINKLPYRINMKSWAAIKNDSEFIKNMTNGIKSLMTNEANNFTDKDEAAFNTELDILKQEFITNRNTLQAHEHSNNH